MIIKKHIKQVLVSGLLAISMLFSVVSCTQSEGQKEESSERDKLIVNRDRVNFNKLENPSKSDLKHTPEITFADNDVHGNSQIRVVVGSEGIEHPYLDDHWIDFIKVYVNSKEIAYNKFTNGGVKGALIVCTKLNKGDKVMVEAGCNLHGIYSREVIF